MAIAGPARLFTALSGSVLAATAAACSSPAPESGRSLVTTTATFASPSTTASSSAAVAPRTVKWIELQPGDCLTAPPPTDPAVVSVTVVDCASPHLSEAFLRAAAPVNAAVDGTADAECETGFAAYTGTPSAGSGYVIAYLIDSEQDRTDNNPYPSTVICLLQSATGQTLNASARA